MPLLQNRYTGRLELIPEAFFLGFISLSIQVIFARLAVGFAGGNEVYLSIFYLFWLLFTGIGAIVIKKLKPEKLFIIFGIFCLFSTTVFFIAPRIFNILPGQLIPPVMYLSTIIVTLLPICLINGGLFSSIAAYQKGKFRSSKTYGAEALGGLTGGLIATIYYIFGGRDFSFLLFIFCICFIPAFKNRYTQAIVIISGVIIMTSGVGNMAENLLLKIRYMPLAFQESVSGRLIRYDSVKTGDMTTLYSGGLKVADFPDEITGQEVFYWPYLVKPDLTSIALVGTEANIVDKFIPAGIKRKFIYPEKSWRRLVAPEYLPKEEDCQVEDPLVFFGENNRKFDAVIIKLGDLLSLYDRRLETKSFFKRCKNSLFEDGILSVMVPSYDGIWRDDMRQRLTEVYVNLRGLFNSVAFIPGDNLTFICGNNLPKEINSELLIYRYKELKIDSPYFNPALIQSRLNSFKLNQVGRQLSDRVEDVGPLAIGHGLSYYFSKLNFSFKFNKIINLFTICIFTLIMIGLIVVLSGFNGSRLLSLINILYFGAISFLIELMVLYLTQLVGGYLYITLGIILGLFMAGMAGGAFWGTYYNNKSNLPKSIYKGSALAIIIFMAISGLLILCHNHQWIMLIVVALAGFAGGLGFAVCAKLFDHKPGLPYGIDLGGAIIGTAIGLGILCSFVYTIEILPVLGAIGLILLATNVWVASK